MDITVGYTYCFRNSGTFLSLASLFSPNSTDDYSRKSYYLTIWETYPVPAQFTNTAFRELNHNQLINDRTQDRSTPHSNHWHARLEWAWYNSVTATTSLSSPTRRESTLTSMTPPQYAACNPTQQSTSMRHAPPLLPKRQNYGIKSTIDVWNRPLQALRFIRVFYIAGWTMTQNKKNTKKEEEDQEEQQQQ